MKKQESKFYEVIHNKCKGTFKLVTMYKDNKLILVCTKCFKNCDLNLLMNPSFMRRVTTKDDIEIINYEKI